MFGSVLRNRFLLKFGLQKKVSLRSKIVQYLFRVHMDFRISRYNDRVPISDYVSLFVFFKRSELSRVPISISIFPKSVARKYHLIVIMITEQISSKSECEQPHIQKSIENDSKNLI